MFLEKKSRRSQIGLNVTAMIDVCAMIIIFLVMGTYFGESSIVVPDSVVIPKSISKESVENAPRLVISDKDVSADFLPAPIPLDLFHAAAGADNAELNRNKAILKAFVAAIPAEARRSGVLLNIIAGRATPYRDIFDVVSFFRSSGFQSMLFVAQGK